MVKKIPGSLGPMDVCRPQSTPTALVVSGDTAESELLRETGRPLGFELTICCDYWHAGWELALRSYDLAVIDIDLEPSLGVEWLSRLHNIAPDLTLIALTGNNSQEQEIAGRNRGISFYFVRPADPLEMAAIFQHVASTKMHQDVAKASATDRGQRHARRRTRHRSLHDTRRQQDGQ